MGLLYSKIINIFYIKKTNEAEQLKIDVSHNATIRKRNHFYDNMSSYDYNTYRRLLKDNNINDDQIYIRKSYII